MAGFYGSAPTQMVSYTLTMTTGDSVVLDMPKKSYDQLTYRSKRSFLVRYPKEHLFSWISSATTYKQLEDIAERCSLCDTSDFSDLNLEATKTVLKTLVNALYMYPRLRSMTCYIGSEKGFKRKFEALARGNLDTLRDFGIQYICSQTQAMTLGRAMVRLADSYIRDKDSFIALAIDAFGLFDAIVLDSQDYEGYKYKATLDNMKYSEKSGFSPKGCSGPDATVYHEIGHLLDYLTGLHDTPEFQRYFSSLSAYAIKSGLSEYASTSSREVIAEAFAEFMCTRFPRRIASDIARMLNNAYKRI